MNASLKASIFDQLKEQLVTDGRMAVIQYDKRSCKSAQAVGIDNLNMSNYTGPWPVCEDLCPSWCPHISNVCGLINQCYNDTNITINDIILDATHAIRQGMNEIKKHLDGGIVNLNQLWSVPIGYSAQGASIASYIQSTINPFFPTVISLMGAGIPIDQLLIKQLQTNMMAMNKTDEEIDAAVNSTELQFWKIRNGVYHENELVHIANDFLDDTDVKFVKYWKDWLDLDENIRYEKLDNFLAINSFMDKEIDGESFRGLMDVVSSDNVSMNMNYDYLQDINHYLINTDKFKNGEWLIDGRISEYIIRFLNDISGYLDRIDVYLNQSQVTPETEYEQIIEDDMVYKVLLYLMILTIIMILSLGTYCIIARKVCPYEFQDDDQQQAEEDAFLRERAERERRRRRRRRHRERRRRSSHHSSRSSRHNNDNNSLINSNELIEPMIQRVESVLEDEVNNINHGDGIDDPIGNGVLNGDLDDPLATSTQNAILNEYVD